MIAEWSIIPSSCRMKFVCRLWLYSAQTLRKKPVFQNKTKQRRLFIYIFDVIINFPYSYSPQILSTTIWSHQDAPIATLAHFFELVTCLPRQRHNFIQLYSLKHWIGLHGKGLLPGQGGGRFAEIKQYNDFKCSGRGWLGARHKAISSYKQTNKLNTNLRVQHLGGLFRPSASGRGGGGGVSPPPQPN